MFHILYTKFQHGSTRNVAVLMIRIVEHSEKHNYEKNEGKVLVLYFNCMEKSLCFFVKRLFFVKFDSKIEFSIVKIGRSDGE